MQTPHERAYFHRGGTEPLRGETLDEHLRAVVARFPDREAVVSLPQGLRRTYAELDRDVEQLARGLMALGVERGAHVGVWATDNLEWVVLQCAVARVGAVLVNVNPAYRLSQLEPALRSARVEVLFLEPAFRTSHYAAMIRELCPELERSAPDELACARLPDLRAVVVFDPARREAVERPAPGFRTWPEVLALGETVSSAQVDARAAAVDFDDAVDIQFTSGTTGDPKAVVLTHHNLLNNAWFAGAAMSFTEQDRLCVPVPFYHCFGMVASTLVCLTRGAAIVIPSPHFEAGATLHAIEAERCTAVHGVPTMFVAELEREDFADHDLSSLRTGIMAGAPCPPELVHRVLEDMGCRELLIGYGQTEASPITHLTDPHASIEERTTTVGLNMPHQEVKVVHPDTGATARRGEVGEVCFRGYHVMRGYLDDPAATARVVDPAGWLHSGDLGAMDERGILRITGRLKDMIIRGGENIYPARIEAVLDEHPDVMDCAVFGVPDDRMGEEVGAWVRLHEGARVDPDALRGFVRGRMAHYEVPRYVWFVDDFPLTVTGKIRKLSIREQVKQWFHEGDPCFAAADRPPREPAPATAGT